jgi:hypothetical protein
VGLRTEHPRRTRFGASGRAGIRTAASAAPTDDEILGIATAAKSAPDDEQLDFDWEDSSADRIPDRTNQGETTEKQTEGRTLESALQANPELKQAWEDVQAYRESFRTPAEARAATASLADLARMDALFFSGRPADHAELARAVASLDPAAFQSLARVMSEVANEGAARPGPSGERAGSQANPSAQDMAAELPSGSTESRATGNANAVDPQERPTAQNADRAGHRTERGITPGQEAFFHSANEAAVRAVVDAIESQVERLLPEEISKGSRNRLIGEIYRELDTSLRSDRQFAHQAREAFRSGALDEDHKRAIVALVNNRARQALPGVARRVLNEWTTAIVAANQDRRARQRAAERRVDIAGSGRTGNDGVRPMTPKDINYARMSDADILNL